MKKKNKPLQSDEELQQTDEERLEGRARSLANLRKPWQKGQSGNPNGRPKGSVNRIPNLVKECLGAKRAATVEGLSSKEIDTIENIVLALGIKELGDLGKFDKAPAYLVTLARAALMDMKNGRTKVMDLLRDRQFGAVKKEVDVTTNGMSVAPTSMTPKEAKEMLDEIEKEF